MTGRTFFTGCTHFGHANIIRLADRPFESVEEMDDALISNWNHSVHPRDTVYHLGDFAFRSVRDPWDYVRRLHGTIVFLQGNHDRPTWGRDILGLRDPSIVLCHYPIEEWNGWWRGSLHFHCHTHRKERWSAERRCNVTVEAWDYRPVSLEEVLESANEEGFLK